MKKKNLNANAGLKKHSQRPFIVCGIRTLTLLLIFSSVTITGCLKNEIAPENRKNNATGSANPKITAQISSSVISYSKDDTTPIFTLDCTPGYTKAVGYSIGPLTVQEADVVSAHLQREVIYSGTNIMIACGIVVATSATCRDNNDAGFLGMLSPFCGSNINTVNEGNMEILTRTGSFKFASASSSIYINAVFYGATFGASYDVNFPAGTQYGELVAVVERGVGYYSSTAHYSPFISGFGYSVPIGGTQYVDNSIGPLNIAPNTMVDVRYQIEATAEIAGSSPAQRLGRKTVYTTSASSTSGTKLTRDSQKGIHKEEVHDVASHVGGAFFGAGGATNAYFNSVVWSYGGSGAPLKVETGGAAHLLYDHFNVETRPYVYFAEDDSRNITAVDGTYRVLYSVGPIDIDANQVVEVRYVAVFGAPATLTPFNSAIIRATSPTATTGVTVQPFLYRKYGPSYVYNNAIHSTAERPSTTQTGQYYNVVVRVPSGGGSIPVMDWGELEVVKR